MSKFNAATKGTKITNRAGGVGYEQNAKLKFVNLLLGTFVENQYYRGADKTITELKELVQKLDPEFCAKAALMVRDEWNMRSVSHVVAGELAGQQKRFSGLRKFFTKVVVRPDDMSEICGYVESNYPNKRRNGKQRLPRALKAGFKKAFDKFDRYQLSKYQMSGKEWSLVDLVNLIGPVPTEKNAEALKALVNDDLVLQGAWESDVSAAGPDKEKKEKAWADLVSEGKMGHFALLRNLRNIAQNCTDAVLDKALSQLTNPEIIQKSRVLPFRYYTAYKQLQEDGRKGTIPGLTKILGALSDAVDISCANVPKTLDNSVVVVDVSGSMDCGLSKKSILTYKEIAAFFGAIAAKSNQADLMLFATHAAYFPYNPKDSTLTICERIVQESSLGYGTAISQVFGAANKKYDRVILFSDMQTWQEGSGFDNYYDTANGASSFGAYKSRYNADPLVYSIDLAGYGSFALPTSGSRIIPMAGWSDKIFDIMELCEQDPNILLNQIEEYPI